MSEKIKKLPTGPQGVFFQEYINDEYLKNPGGAKKILRGPLGAEIYKDLVQDKSIRGRLYNRLKAAGDIL